MDYLDLALILSCKTEKEQESENLKQSSFNTKTNMILLVLGSGILGGFFFFPINIANQYTCLYHRIFFTELSYNHSNDTSIALPDTSTKDSHASHETRNLPAIEAHGEELLRRYVSSYALLWFGSLAIVALCIYGLRRLWVAESQANILRNRSSAAGVNND